MISFFAAGIPQPQGNKTGFVRGGRVVMVEGRRQKSRDAFADWRTAVRTAAAAARPAETITGPVHLCLRFTLPAPASLPKRRVRLHTTRPDLDKLIRAVLDAIVQAAVLRDDSQVVGLDVAKGYPLVDGRLGVWVQIVDHTDATETWRNRFYTDVALLDTQLAGAPA